MPGMFYIGKLLRNTPHREAFTVNSHGFWFRREVRQWSQVHSCTTLQLPRQCCLTSPPPAVSVSSSIAETTLHMQ